jgi:hypothetical protein
MRPNGLQVVDLIHRELYDRCKTKTFLSDVPDTIIMFQNTSANEVEAVECIDEGLTSGGVICEGANAKLATRNGQVERFSIL